MATFKEMTNEFREEFRIKNFGFKLTNHKALTTSQWEWHPVIFLVYRFILCGYTLGYWIGAVAEAKNKAKMGIYLTHWSYTMLTLHFLVAFIVAVITYIRKPEASAESEKQPKENLGFETIELETGETKAPKQNTTEQDPEKAEHSGKCTLVPWYMIISWILYDVILVFSIIVTGIYFGAVHDPKDGLDHYNFNRHGLNTVLMVIDFVISGTPIRILHMIYPMIYGFIYIIFNVIYWAFDKKNNIVYSILNYNPKTLPVAVGVILGLLIVGIPLLTIIFYGLFRLKRWIYFKIYKKDYVY